MTKEPFASDWIRLLVKYKGECKECGREISAGEYALWSRTSRAIQHEKCNLESTLVDRERNSDSNRGSSETVEVELSCFVCGQEESIFRVGELNRSASGFRDRTGRDISSSDVHFCKNCISNPNAYENYQEAFLKIPVFGQRGDCQ